MQVKCIAECSRGAFCSTLTCIKLPHGFQTLVLSVFEWSLKTGFTVYGICASLVYQNKILFFRFSDAKVSEGGENFSIGQKQVRQ